MNSSIQQINLYQLAEDTGKEPFSLRTAVLLMAAVAVCLAALSAFGQWRVQRLAQAVIQLRLQQEHQTQTLATLTAARVTGASPEQLEARAKGLSAQLAAHSRVLQLVKNGGVGQSGGFSRTLSALARHPLDGLWIDRIVLGGIGKPKLGIEGIAVDPELVPKYLHGLGKEGALLGLRFDEFTIERSSAARTATPETPQQEPSAVGKNNFVFKADSDATRASEKDRRS